MMILNNQHSRYYESDVILYRSMTSLGLRQRGRYYWGRWPHAQKKGTFAPGVVSHSFRSPLDSLS